MNVSSSNALPVFDNDNIPPAPPLVHAASNPQVYAPHPNVEIPNAAPANLAALIAGAPALQLQQNVPQIHQAQVGNNHQFEDVQHAINQNVHMVPPVQEGPIGLVFNPPPGVQLPGAQPGPHNPQGPIGGRKSRRRKSHRRKSYRRKSHRR